MLITNVLKERRPSDDKRLSHRPYTANTGCQSIKNKVIMNEIKYQNLHRNSTGKNVIVRAGTGRHFNSGNKDEH